MRQEGFLNTVPVFLIWKQSVRKVILNIMMELACENMKLTLNHTSIIVHIVISILFQGRVKQPKMGHSKRDAFGV